MSVSQCQILADRQTNIQSNDNDARSRFRPTGAGKQAKQWKNGLCNLLLEVGSLGDWSGLVQ